MSNSYCLGFAFLPTLQGLKVVLINKTKPAWQRGKLNGVGGKIETGETCNVAMAREFKEETGCDTFCTDWVKFTEMRFAGDHGNGSHVIVHCFALMLPSHKEVRTTTEEVIELLDIRDCYRDPRMISNLHWLIPMARFALEKEYEDGSLPHTLDHV